MVPAKFWRRQGDRKNRLLKSIIGTLLGLAALALGVESSPVRAAAARDAETFGLVVVHQFHLDLSAKEYDAMQPASSEGRFQPGRPPAPPKAIETGAETHRSGFMDYPWAHGSFTANGNAYTNVAIRYKGRFTYGVSRELLKRSLKIDLAHYDAKSRWGSLRRITLNAGVLDPGRLREALAYAAYRDGGVPAPRTAFAEVTLTVPGRYNRELLGLFTMVEDVDKAFLNDRFKDADGLLMKPEGVRGVEDLGEDWSAYKTRLNPERDATAAEAKHLVNMARLIDKADDAEFRQKIGECLDVDKFLRYLAVTVMLASLDSPLAMPQNFFVYLPAKTRKAVFMPWDQDLAFAAWPMGGAPAQQMNLSLIHPYTGQHRLIERLLAAPEIRARYLAIVKELSTTSFSERELLSRIARVESAINKPLAREAEAVSARHESEAGSQAGGITSQAPALREFAVERSASIRSQLKNPETGYIPAGMGGPPPNLPAGLRMKMDQFRAAIEERQRSGKTMPAFGPKLQKFGPLLGAGKFTEAEALLDQVLVDLKSEK
jgi:spore coat protein CotH